MVFSLHPQLRKQRGKYALPRGARKLKSSNHWRLRRMHPHPHPSSNYKNGAAESIVALGISKGRTT
jgi:hypothetical protein